MKNEIASFNLLIDIKKIIEESTRQVVRNVNTTMLQTYWNIGRRIVEEEQNGNYRAEYGSSLLKELSRELTKEYGKGFSRSNLQSMRNLYLNYEKCQTLSGKLSWSHYLLLLSVSDLNARSFYEHECENSNWSVIDSKDKSIRLYMKDFCYRKYY